MDGYEAEAETFRALGVAVYGASVDAEEDATKLADRLSYPIAYGVTRQDAERIGAFWDEPGGFVQPTEFILQGRGKVVASTYSSSPVGRIHAQDAIAMVKMLRKNA